MIRTTLLIATTVAAFVTSPGAKAENLLVNPGFESGALTPGWTASGTVSVVNTVGSFTEGTRGASLAANIALPGTPTTLSQTFPTVAGTSYLVKFDFSNPVATGVPGIPGFPVLQPAAAVQVLSGSATGLAIQMLPSTLVGFQNQYLVFTADSATSTLKISYSNPAGFGSLLVDNFQAAKASFAKPGKKFGSMRVTTSVPGREISSAHLLKVVARIDSAGRFYLITQPDGATFEGFIGDDKSVNLPFSATAATATISGNPATIKFSYQSELVPGLTNFTSET